jgi:hypothetical protein
MKAEIKMVVQVGLLLLMSRILRRLNYPLKRSNVKDCGGHGYDRRDKKRRTKPASAQESLSCISARQD